MSGWVGGAKKSRSTSGEWVGGRVLEMGILIVI